LGKLDDRVAVVTSSTRGVGRAVANAFLAEGATVLLNGRSEEKGRRALEELDAGERVRFVPADVSSREGCELLLGEALERWGRVDVLVNNAGGTREPSPIAEMSDEVMQMTLEWTFWSTFWCTRLALADMIPRRSGRIINVSSLEGKCGKPITSAYVAAKHAVNGLTKSCAQEVGPLGITVNALCPGIMVTDIVHEVGVEIAAEQGLSFDEFLGSFSTDAANGRANDVDDVAAIAVLLASEAGAGISGSLISVDGGTAPF
jgi:NAD(P)-dependent dehydrogenase (short-subunit alcohol dehydrogenase family)